MADSGAYEIRREGRVYRAPSVEVLVKWAAERRITADDEIRPAGDGGWSRAGDHPDLGKLLDPSNWWTVRMGDDAYTAPDFETVVRWTREGRLTSDAVIEGPRTPPGGVLAQGLPRLSPFLRPAGAVGGETPPRLRIDRIEYHPGDMETVKAWISESRVPVDAEISLAGGPWEPISECGAFEPESWPSGAWGDRTPDEPESAGPAARSAPPEAPSSEFGAVTAPGPVRVEPAPHPQPLRAEPAPGGARPGPVQYRILSGRGEVVARSVSEIRSLLRRKRIHSFDEVLAPGLPEGRASVGAVLEGVGRGRRRGLPAWAVWVLVAAALALAFFVIDPLGTGYLGALLSRLGIPWR
ncbi:MAG: hypothetical protein QUS11_04275 [Candidatus Fermentibacter sp.]|nr:hypothetical protein [Candidatus Fermentibacter sp.]